MRFDAITIFLLKCGIIPPWEVKLQAFVIAARMFHHYGGSPKNPATPGQEIDEWVWDHWREYVDMAKSQLLINRPRWR